VEAQISAIFRELEKIQERSTKAHEERVSDRVKVSENLAEVRVLIAGLQHRLETIEGAMLRLMANSTWLLRILVGAVAVASVNFLLEGGLAHVRP
jgi:hypothetical protein